MSQERSIKKESNSLQDISKTYYKGVGAKIRLRWRSWSRGRRWDLQKKSKPEVGLLRQDPPTLKSVLCLNKNGVLERKF